MYSMRIIGHGVDIVEISRISELLEAHGDRFLARCFTDGERKYAETGRKRRAERYAARFACKEAVLKVIGTGWRDGISWCDIDVLREPSGQPQIAISGRCAEIAQKLGIVSWNVSLSHTDKVAIASVIGCGD